MVQIVLIRPGSTNYDEQGRIQGTLDIPLSPQGNAKAQQLSEELRQFDISLIYAAPCQAAWQTASVIGQGLGVKVKKIELQNLDHGLWQGMEVDEIRRKHPKVFRQWQEQPEIICPPEGEMLGQAQQRVKVTLNKLMRKHKQGATLGLVVPEPLATLVHSFLTQSELGDLWKLGASCGCWELIKPVLEPLNYRGIKVNQEKIAAKNGVVPIGLD